MGPGELRSPPADFAHQRMETVNRLALGLTHEFDNVLQIVHGYISSARGALPFESEPRQDLEAALRATNLAAELASRLLQFTRAQDEENRAADISDTVVATKLLLRPIIGENIHSGANAREGLPDARVNETSIR